MSDKAPSKMTREELLAWGMNWKDNWHRANNEWDKISDALHAMQVERDDLKERVEALLDALVRAGKGGK